MRRSRSIPSVHGGPHLPAFFVLLIDELEIHR